MAKKEKTEQQKEEFKRKIRRARELKKIAGIASMDLQPIEDQIEDLRQQIARLEAVRKVVIQLRDAGSAREVATESRSEPVPQEVAPKKGILERAIKVLEQNGSLVRLRALAAHVGCPERQLSALLDADPRINSTPLGYCMK